MDEQSLKTQEQSVLFPDLERDLLTIDQPDTRKRYTAASLEKRVYLRDLIVRALVEGHGLRRIATAFSVSHHLVSALRDSRPDLVATEKKAMSQQLARIAKMTADSIQERLEAGTWKPGSVDLAIILDKKAMLDGDPGLIVEHRHAVEVSVSELEDRMRAAIEAKSTGLPRFASKSEVVVDVVASTVADDAGHLVQVGTTAPSESVSGQPDRKAGGGDQSGGGAACDPIYQAGDAK